MFQMYYYAIGQHHLIYSKSFVTGYCEYAF